MQETAPFPSIHTRCYLLNGRVCSLYEIGRSLSRSRLDGVVKALHSQGHPIESLEFYEYGDSDTLRHLFVKLEGQEVPIPYFQLEKKVWQMIVKELVASARQQ